MTDTMWDFDDWPDVAPTEILPGMFVGGTADEDYIGSPAAEGHYAFNHPYDVVLTLFADAQPVPWGVTELRYGFPDDEVQDHWAINCLAVAHFGFTAWHAGSPVLVRCQQGVNRSGFVAALMLLFNGYSAEGAIALLRERRGPAMLNNESLELWLVQEAASRVQPRVHGA
ncbi:MAG: hypothetical protein NTX29_13945 [Actinobacteria bacterium]|nr:hypothetical protein [Actinomycetota bacterium]